MLAKIIDSVDNILMFGGISIKSYKRYLQKAVAELRLVKSVESNGVISEINKILASDYSAEAVKKLIRELQNDPNFKEPLLAIGDGILTSGTITPLHRAWSFMIESIIEFYKETKSIEELIQLEAAESARLLSESDDDSPLDATRIAEKVKEQNGAPWFDEWRTIRNGIMFENPVKQFRVCRYLTCHHYFSVDKNYSFEEKLNDVWRLTFNKHFSNAPLEYGLRLISSSYAYPYISSIKPQDACLYDPKSHSVKELSFSSLNLREGNSPYYESEKSLPPGVKPKLAATRLYLCHAVIVREIATQRVWVEHIEPDQVRKDLDIYTTPAYIFYSAQHGKYPNPNCLTGEIEVFVVDKEGAFSEEAFRKRVNSFCKIKSLQIFRYSPKTSYQESKDSRINYSVCYDLQTDTLMVSTYFNDVKPHIITTPFSAGYPNLVSPDQSTLSNPFLRKF